MTPAADNFAPETSRRPGLISRFPSSGQFFHNSSGLRFSPELELLICCARLELGANHITRAQELLDKRLCWDVLCHLAHTQGLMPLLYHHISRRFANKVSAENARHLRDSFLRNLAKNSLLIQEIAKVLQALRGKKIDAIPFRGLVIAEELYGSIALRQCGDMDFLIAAESLPATIQVLSTIGYELTLDLTPEQLEAYVHTHNEILFRHSSTASVDLHWDIMPRFLSLSVDPSLYRKNLRRIQIGDTKALSLSAEDLLLLLCIHGGKHLWEKLIWLCDISELIGKHENLNWDDIIHTARKVGAHRLLLVGLCLMNALLGTALPEIIKKESATDRAAASLSARLYRNLINAVQPTEIDIDLFWFRVRERWSDKIRFLTRYPTTPTSVEYSLVALSKPLFPLYRVLRLTRASRRIAGLAGERLSARIIPQVGK